MKKTSLILFLILNMAGTAIAQVPQGIPFQAVARNASGQTLDNRPVKVRFSVIDSIALGTAVYVEAHSTTTNSLGLFSVNVGMGTPVNGSFNGINWGLNSKFLKVELDTTASGNSFVDLGSQQMMSVPYALYAGSSSSISGIGSEGQVLTSCNGIPVWTNGGQCPGRINSLNCLTAINSGTLTSGTAASGVSSLISYTGGNGGPFASQSISSTGVTGLTASLSPGSFANGAGSLNLTISGVPASSGIAKFTLSLGGQICNLERTINPAVGAYPTGSIFCASGPTVVVDVVNPVTGKIWMDRNLGAASVATSSTDANAYGDLYQWGRRSDGHQCRNSTFTTTLSNTDQPLHGEYIYITTPATNNQDWRSPQNDNLWQGLNGINNPCPIGYRIPTDAELNFEIQSWNSTTSIGAFASPLKLPMSGYRDFSGGLIIVGVGSNGRYWSSTINSSTSRSLSFSTSFAAVNNFFRAYGVSVRCIKN